MATGVEGLAVVVLKKLCRLLKEGDIATRAAGRLGSGPGHPGDGLRWVHQCLHLVAPSDTGGLESILTPPLFNLFSISHCFHFSSFRMIPGCQGLVLSSGIWYNWRLHRANKDHSSSTRPVKLEKQRACLLKNRDSNADPNTSVMLIGCGPLF